VSRVCVCVGWLSGRPPLSVDRGHLLVDSWWLAVDGGQLLWECFGSREPHRDRTALCHVEGWDTGLGAVLVCGRCMFVIGVMLCHFRTPVQSRFFVCSAATAFELVV
jgi:hypothetical protein